MPQSGLLLQAPLDRDTLPISTAESGIGRDSKTMGAPNAPRNLSYCS
jgi:hypothetical protein